jgi:hypothetical protein
MNTGKFPNTSATDFEWVRARDEAGRTPTPPDQPRNLIEQCQLKHNETALLSLGDGK